jgi:hypothetical protein
MAVRATVDTHRGQDPGMSSCETVTSDCTNCCMQGFDEFMNLVIDDAVEVKQITKTNDKETRRSLGGCSLSQCLVDWDADLGQVKYC